METKPTFFISSTIYDFRDLRSALKHYLESLDFKVYLSEENDFLKDTAKHSYDACLDTIEKVDYFILLIGGRVGGWYDKDNKVSITQQEYKVAYEQAKKGKLKILSFVRDEIWTIKEDRRQLEKLFLENFEKSKENQIKDIMNQPTNFINDAEFIFNFINEVGKNKETKKALDDKEILPASNWIHSFKSFKDIIDVIDTTLLVNQNLNLKKMKANLKFEIINNLRYLFYKSEGKFQHHIKKWGNDRSRFKNGVTLLNTISGSDIYWFSDIVRVCNNAKINSTVLKNSIISGMFLSYNTAIYCFEETELSIALKQLYSSINKFEFRAEQIFKFNIMIKLMEKIRDRPGYKKSDLFDIDYGDMLILFSLFDRADDIIKLSVAILKYLINSEDIIDLQKLNLNRPIDENYEEEFPSKTDVMKYLYKF